MKKRTGPKRISIIWKMPRTNLIDIVKNSSSIKEILSHFGLDNKGSNYKTLKKRLNEDNIDFSHIPQGIGWNRGLKFNRKKRPLEEVMVKNSNYSRSCLKDRLIRNNILENKCAICYQIPEHNNLKLVMVLDHINGKSNDHRRENLRLLCPNCNSQQKTFAGKSNKIKRYCSLCNNEIIKNRKYCDKCYKDVRKKRICISRRKVKERPSKEQLLKEIEETNYCAVGRKYGVSDNCIRKWLK